MSKQTTFFNITKLMKHVLFAQQNIQFETLFWFAGKNLRFLDVQ